MANNKTCLRHLKMTLVTAVLLLAAQTQAETSTSYQLADAKQIDIHGRIDFLTLYDSGSSLFAGHGNSLALIDSRTLEKQAEIPLSESAQGMAINNATARGYVSLGNANAIEVIDLKSRKSLSVMQTAEISPGQITIDQASGNIYSADLRTAKLLALNSTSGAQTMISVAGQIHSMISNQRGYLFASIANKPVVEVIDVHMNKSLGEINLLGCESTTGLAIDIHERRLFVACSNGWMQILDTDTGYRLNRLPIGKGGGQVGLDFEPDRVVNIFTLSKQRQLNIGKVKKVTFSNEQTLEHPLDNATMLVDDSSGRVFISSGTRIQAINKL